MTLASIVNRVHGELSALGFKKKKTTWNRLRDSFVDVIDLQISKGGDSVTLNVGVMSRPVHAICWGNEAKEFVDEPFCTVRARIGQLLDNKDLWWALDDAESIDAMIRRLHARILPFISSMQSLQAMRDWLFSSGIPSPREPLPTIIFAVLQSRLGNTSDACAVLEELERKALGAWRERAREVALRIGCDLAPQG